MRHTPHDGDDWDDDSTNKTYVYLLCGVGAFRSRERYDDWIARCTRVGLFYDRQLYEKEIILSDGDLVTDPREITCMQCLVMSAKRPRVRVP
jgi:hypothetical protein